MTATPWGDVRELRTRDLAPEPERRRRAVRERILAAMVTTVAERGYRATRVDDVVELAGVTRADFDALFDDRLDCFVETLEAIVVLAEAAMAVELVRDAPWDARLRRSFQTLIDLIVAHPAAARLCLVDAYGAGPEAVAYLDRMTRAAGRRAVAVLAESPERAEIPRDVARAVIGGLRKVVQTRLYTGRERELPELAPALMDWALSYRTPPVSLRPVLAPPAPAPPSAPAADGRARPRERLLAAVAELVAEKGYANLDATEVAERADTSLERFYEGFGSTRAALEVALDETVARLLAATTSAYRDAPDWPRGVHAGVRAVTGHLSRNPTAARFTAAAAWGGADVLTALDASMAGFGALLAEGLRGRSPAPGIAAEAIGSSILALVFERTTYADPARLYEIAPAASFVAIAPAVGAIEACAVINGD